MTNKIPSFKEEIDMIHVPTDKLNTIISNFSLDSVSRKQQAKRKRNRILIAAACLLIGLPTTAFGAVKVYDMMVQKQNYEVNISVTNKASNKSDKWYKLKVGNLPENMEADDADGMKYSFKDNYAKGGFSFILWRLGGNSDFSTLYTKGYKKVGISGKNAVIVNKDTGNPNMMFNRQVFLLFEEEGIMLESYIGNDVSDEQMMKVMENISLEPTTKENASFTAEYDKAHLSKASKPTESKVIPLKKDSNQIFSVGQTVPVTIDQAGGESSLNFVIEKVEVFDSIADFKQGNFNESGLDRLSEKKALDQTKNLMRYKRNVYKLGNGKDSIDQLTESKLVNLKFVYLTTTLENAGSQSTDAIYMYHPLRVLQSENNTWKYTGRNGFNEQSLMTSEVDYLEPHGNGKSYYNIGCIQPGQTVKVNLGYFVDADKLDSIFLDAFPKSGYGNTEDMNAKNRWWIDIRQ
jgi:cytochrome c oxidase assembly protein Cox11